MKNKKFYKKDKNYPNKLRIVQWDVSFDNFYLFENTKKDYFLNDLFFLIRHGHRTNCFLRCSNFRNVNFLGKRPSLKEKSWFMGTLPAGCFHFFDDFNLNFNLGRSFDPGVFFYSLKNAQIFLNKNFIIAPFEAFEKGPNRFHILYDQKKTNC